EARVDESPQRVGAPLAPSKRAPLVAAEQYRQFLIAAHVSAEVERGLHQVFAEVDRLRRQPAPPSAAEDQGAARYFAIVQAGLMRAERLLQPEQRVVFRTQIAPIFPKVVSAATAPFDDDDPEFQAIYEEFMRRLRKPTADSR